MKKFVLLLAFLSTSAFADNYWLKAGNGETCNSVCSRGTASVGSLNAVEAGTWSGNNNAFFVCAGADQRPGYQIAGFANNLCVVPFGGNEVPVGNYFCLCTNDSGDTPFLDGR